MGFDRVARVYRPLERLAFGGALQRARTAHLPVFAAAEKVLLVGDGDGRFLEALLRTETSATIISVDASESMLEIARRRAAAVSGAARVEFCHARVEDFEPPAGFRADVLGLHFVLDCFPDDELPAVLERVGSWVRAEGCLVVTDFARPTGGALGRFAAGAMLWLMLRFFRLTAGIRAKNLPKIGQSLAAAGWQEVARRRWRSGFLSSDVWRRTSERC